MLSCHAGYVRNEGSMRGNDCFISSAVQTLQGACGSSQRHLDICADIRNRGRGVAWDSGNFIEASEATLEFVTQCVLGENAPPVHIIVYSGRDGLQEKILNAGCESRGDVDDPRAIHIFSLLGVCFDPSWPAEAADS